MTERWAPIGGWPDYEVSDRGRVRRAAAGPGAVVGRVLQQAVINRGYAIVTLCRGGERKTRYVHRLVAAVFLPAPAPEQTQVAHNDGDSLRNVWTNLRWATAQENSDDCAAHGTRARPKGVANAHAKLTDEDVCAIRARSRREPQARLAEQFGVSSATVSLVVNRKAWRHVS